MIWLANQAVWDLVESCDDCQSSFKKAKQLFFLIVTIHWTVSPRRCTVMSSSFSSTPLGSAVMSSWHRFVPQWDSGISAKVPLFSVSSSQIDSRVNRLQSQKRKNGHCILPRKYCRCCSLRDDEFFVNTCVCVCDWTWLLSLHIVTDLEPVLLLCSKFLYLGGAIDPCN